MKISSRAWTLVAAAVALAAAAWFLRPGGARAARDPDADDGKPAAAGTLQLNAEARARIGLETKSLDAVSMQPEVAIYGRLEEDPSQSFVVRAPAAGTLRAARNRSWPGLGETLADGAVIGAVEPRLAPADRIQLMERLTAARSEARAAEAALEASRAAHARARRLNADNKNVSDRSVEEAAARWKADEARAEAARQTVGLIESSLRPAEPALQIPLTVERGGEVVETQARPGEAVESGAPLVRVSRLNRLLARVHAPAGERIPSSATAARIVILGFEDREVAAVRAALAAAADPKLQGEPLLFRLLEVPFGARPGLSVTARVALPGKARKGVIVPRAALVRQDADAFVYLQIAEGQFSRRRIDVSTPVADGYFVSEGLGPGDRIVVVGAQALLSEELKYKIPRGGID